MTYFLDTDTCIFALRGERAIKEHMRPMFPKQIKIPAIVRAELLYGALRSKEPKQTLVLVERFLEPFEIIAFGADQAAMHAKIKIELTHKGNLIGPHDLMIAAIVLSYQGTMITHNVKEFTRVSGLLVEDWMTPSS